MLETTARITGGGCTVEIANARWPQPIEYNWKDERAVLTMIYQPSSYHAMGQYVDGVPAFESIGSIFLIPPNKELLGRGPGGEHGVLRCIFEPDAHRTLLERMARLTSRQLSQSLDIGTPTIASFMRRLAHEARAPGLSSELLVQSIGSALLVECTRQLFETDERVAPQATEGSGPGVLEFIDCFLDEEIRFPNVKGLARRCGVSSSHLGKLFRRETGQTIGRYLADARMLRAEALLSDTGLSLKEVAFRLGFSNTANFSTSFKSMCGQSPAAYRRRVLGTRNLCGRRASQPHPNTPTA